MLAIRWRSIGRDAWIVFYALVVSEIMTSLLRFDAQRLAVANHCQTHVHSITVLDMVELTSLIEISDKTFTYYIFNCTVHLHSLELYSFGFFFIFLSISFRHHRARRSTEKMKLASRRNDAMANDARPTNTAARTVFALTSMAVCTFIIMLRNFFLFFYFLLLPNISFASYEFILRIDFCFPSEFFRIIFFVCCVVCFGIVGLRYAKICYSCRVDYYYFFSLKMYDAHRLQSKTIWRKTEQTNRCVCPGLRPALCFFVCFQFCSAGRCCVSFENLFSTHTHDASDGVVGRMVAMIRKNVNKKLEHPLTIGRQKSVYSSLFNLAFGCLAHALIRASKLNRTSDCWHGTVTRDIFKTKNKTEN